MRELQVRYLDVLGALERDARGIDGEFHIAAVGIAGIWHPEVDLLRRRVEIPFSGRIKKAELVLHEIPVSRSVDRARGETEIESKHGRIRAERENCLPLTVKHVFCDLRASVCVVGVAEYKRRSGPVACGLF